MNLVSRGSRQLFCYLIKRLTNHQCSFAVNFRYPSQLHFFDLKTFFYLGDIQTISSLSETDERQDSNVMRSEGFIVLGHSNLE
jgi:hypothetical protein